MTRVLFAILTLVLASTAFAQGPTNTGGTVGAYQKWPDDPPIGIGTELDGGVRNAALQIHYNSAENTKPAILRFSQGGSTNTIASGILALIPIGPLPDSLRFSSLITGQDFVLRANHGDLILTDNWQDATSGAIRMATRPVTTLLPPAPVVDTDYERLTVLNNGNVGINVPHDSASHIATPKEQLQIGGGSFDVLGSRIPGLTIYGGNQFEGMLKPFPAVAENLPVDARYLAFNYATDHYDTSSSRATRLAPLASSRILFDHTNGGVLEFECDPFDTARGLKDFRRGVHMLMMGDKGIECWSDESDSNANHHLFDVWRPKFPGYNMNIGGDSLRNENGLFVHYTPVLISETSNWNVPNFTNLTNVNPSLGDGKTWMLAVNGPALFKEAYVNENDWPDYVFDPSHQLLSLDSVKTFIDANHHLPGVPSASSIAKTGIPLGKTEALLLEKVEELTKYAILEEQEIKELKAEIDALRKGGQK